MTFTERIQYKVTKLITMSAALHAYCILPPRNSYMNYVQNRLN